MDNKKFYKMVMMLVIPMALQNIISVGIQSIDVIMLGKVGEVVLSASSLAGQVNFIMNLVLFGLASGSTVLVAQYWGKGDIEAIEKIFGIALKLALLIGALFTTASLIFAKEILQIFSSDPDVIKEGIVYLRILSLSFIISAFTMIYLNIMRSIEKVMISTVVYLFSMIVNAVVNSLLIFGLLGFPKMGIAGAAIGTLIARIVELITVIVYNNVYNQRISVKNAFVNRNNKSLINDFFRFSTPVILNELLWGLGISITAAILGQMGKKVAAANSVVQVARQLAMVVSMGIANAAAVMLGKVIGEGKIELAKSYSRKFIKLAVISGTLGGLIILLIRPILVANLSLSTQAKSNLSYMMIILSYYVLFQAISCTGIVGILRAGGDTKYGVLIDVSTLWFGSILFGYLATFVFKIRFEYFYIILLCDEPLKIPLFWLRYRSYKWLNSVTRTKEELEKV